MGNLACILFFLFTLGSFAQEVEPGMAADYQFPELREKPPQLTLLWDTSYSMQKREHGRELELLDRYFAYLGNVSVILRTFGYELDEPRRFEVENGNWDMLKKSITDIHYDGAVRLDVLDRLRPGNFNILVTDGIGFPIGTGEDWTGEVFVLNSGKNANHGLLEELATSRGANYLPLHYIRGQEDALASLKGHREQMSYEYAQPTSYYREIRGNVSDFDDPLANVLVAVTGTNRTTTTNSKGDFRINASTNEVLDFSAQGRENTRAMVNNSTRLLNITMPLNAKVLDEVILEQGEKQAELESPLHEDVSTNFGPLNARKSGFAIKQIEGERLSPSAQTITDALEGKFPGVRIIGRGPNARVFLRVGSRFFAAWDVDGLLYSPENPPLHINVQNIKKITIMPGSWAAARYGRMASGGIIIVRTISQDIQNNRQLEHNRNTRTNTYKEDAATLVQHASSRPGYIQILEEGNTAEESYGKYLSLRARYDHRPDFYYDTYRWFAESQPSANYAGRILSNVRELFSNDVTALRMEAFVMEEQGQFNEALQLYRSIHMGYRGAQSLRDFARVNVKAGDIKRGWRLYSLYLSQNDSLYDHGTDRLVRTEMLELLRNHRELRPARISEAGLKSDLNDMRMVVAWNNPNAQFELQFVGPQGLYYVWNNTTDMPLRDAMDGSLSDSFEIADLAKGSWLINVKYLGNQEDTSSYLKFDLIDNRNATERTQILQLDAENLKYRFLEINTAGIVSLIP